MEVGAYVWCSQPKGDEAWILAEVIKKKDDELQLQQVGQKDNVFTRPVEIFDKESGERKFQGVELANTKLSDDERAEGRDNDLITLPHLHEPALLHALSERFFYGKIYTWTGPVLIAVNPFQRLPLYTDEILDSYRSEGLFRSQGMGNPKKDLDPHVFAIADRSYRQMMSEQRRSQSILISGESGAGKTESTKIVMSYLTTLGGMGVEQEQTGELSVMERVLQSNPVLEAFGNARTLRNDNSSRFGKFIELGFSRAGHLLGARVQTYLLEKVRLAFHASGERNYHIFYQLLRGANDEQKQKYHLLEGDTGGVELPNHFHYTKQGGAPQLREFTDESGLAYTLKAMKALGWSEETIDNVLAIIAGLLHLGEISFNSKETASGQDAADVASREVMERCSSLLGVDIGQLEVALTERVVVARGEEIRTELTPDRAVDARDALAKTVYGALFLWVVDQVNQSIRWEKDDEIRSSVGVLDIFGFECFAINSFEQLCINFTNEALQQQFNKFIFKLEQTEYENEQIEWAFISFPDNQDCLDTIQQKKIGILSMLDDECRLPKGSDKNWAKRMYEEHLGKNEVSENTRFSATKMQQAKAIFCIRHFAGIVEYRAETSFMEKNKDEIPLAAQTLFESAPSQLMKDVYSIQKKETEDRSGDANKRGPAKSKTVGQQFKEQLSSLIASVEKTDPHYIRCLKPNDAAKPKMLTRKRLTEQLRYGGVLEAVRVARAGYPVRLTHTAFFQRYRMLLPTTPEDVIPWNMEGNDPQQLCVALLVACLQEGQKQIALAAAGKLEANEPGIPKSEKIRRMQNQPIPMAFPQTDVQLGLTKVFMRKPPHDALEAHRVFHQHASATMIQCWVRGLEQRKRFYIFLDAVAMVQRVYRGCKGRERWTFLRRAQASLLLTNHYRMQINRRKYNRAKRGSIRYQALFRGFAKRRVLAAIKLQTFRRMYRLRTNYRMLKSALLALQCAVRARIARAVLKGLMGEQKDIGKLKENNEKLKMEMQSLKAMLAAQAKEDASNLAHTLELESKQKQILELEKRVADLEKQLASEKALVEKLEADLLLQRQQPLVSPSSPRGHHRMRSTESSSASAPQIPEADVSSLQMPNLPSNYVSPEVVAQHRAKLSGLEDELSAERKLRREADREIIKLRAAINGVELNDAEVDALLAQKLEAAPSAKTTRRETPEVTGGEETKTQTRSSLATLTEGIASAFKGSDEKKESRFSLSVDLLPRIRRGFTSEEKEADPVFSVGWKAVVRSRKEREEVLRDEVHRFESKMSQFEHSLEEGVDVVMWQMNRADDKEGPVEFPLKSSHVTVQMQRKGDMYVQSVLNFVIRGGYLSKAIGRNRGVNKSALEPLSLHDILEVKAGCSGYDHTELPSAAGRSKSKGKSSKGENRQGSLFVTLTATPTPMAASRSYILRFKSRSARNDLLTGLRSILADMQIHEGVSVSGLHSASESMGFDEEADVMVPLGAVHKVLNREREAYDRILLMLLQGSEDLKEKEDDLVKMRSKLESVLEESAEKDRVQANDSKLIMQLSKKLETLLMDNEDLRDQNDRLNTRLIAAECEKMNMMT
jgi:myosin-5